MILYNNYYTDAETKEIGDWGQSWKQALPEDSINPQKSDQTKIRNASGDW